MSSTPRVGTLPPYGIKAPVVASTTANITLSGEQTIDSVAVVAGDRVLVRSQSDNTENGVYDCASGTWSRSTDFNDSGDIVNGVMVLDTNSGIVYQASFSGTYNPGTTTITFVEASSGFASAAAASATSAQTYASNAASSESAASASASAASASATAASGYAASAATSATNIQDLLPSPASGDAGKTSMAKTGGGGYINVADVAVGAGSATAITASIGIDAYNQFQTFRIKVPATNTGACTLNLDSLGAKSIKLMDGSDPSAGQIVANYTHSFRYDGTNMVLLDPKAGSTKGAAGTDTESLCSPSDVKSYVAGQLVSNANDDSSIGIVTPQALMATDVFPKAVASFDATATPTTITGTWAVVPGTGGLSAFVKITLSSSVSARNGHVYYVSWTSGTTLGGTAGWYLAQMMINSFATSDLYNNCRDTVIYVPAAVSEGLSGNCQIQTLAPVASRNVANICYGTTGQISINPSVRDNGVNGGPILPVVATNQVIPVGSGSTGSGTSVIPSNTSGWIDLLKAGSNVDPSSMTIAIY